MDTKTMCYLSLVTKIYLNYFAFKSCFCRNERFCFRVTNTNAQVKVAQPKLHLLIQLATCVGVVSCKHKENAFSDFKKPDNAKQSQQN